ncbi:hypothetical protein [Pseudophaeobacter sp. C1-32P7]|uniref:hypothetical protein n=1 Tax=Pseudophaeobacter sp. C1-32P7 TaxID=3098142 RepID=UPI0034D3E325
MSVSRSSLTCGLTAGNFPGGPGAAGIPSATHGVAVPGELAQARSVLAKVADHGDTEIARACMAVLESSLAEQVERRDASAMLERVPLCLIARLKTEESSVTFSAH